MGKKCKCPPKGAPAYMNTFGDMMSLLLCFFVLLVSMANFEPMKFIQAMQSIQGGFGILESFPTVAVNPVIKTPKYGKDKTLKKESFKDAEQIEESMQKQDLEDAVKVKVTETGIAVMLKDPVGFASGDDRLTAKARTALKEVSKVLRNKPHAKVRVEGHTDDVPIRSQKFPSNWELSSSRALNVVKALATESGIDPGNLSGVGYGEHRPLVPNTSRINRTKNRRIEIYIDYTKKEEG